MCTMVNESEKKYVREKKYKMKVISAFIIYLLNLTLSIQMTNQLRNLQFLIETDL